MLVCQCQVIHIMLTDLCKTVEKKLISVGVLNAHVEQKQWYVEPLNRPVVGYCTD